MTPEVEKAIAALEDARAKVAEKDAVIQDCLKKSKEYRLIRQQAELDRAALQNGPDGVVVLEQSLVKMVDAENLRRRQEAKKKREEEEAANPAPPPGPSPQEQLTAIQKQVAEMTELLKAKG